MQPEKYPQTPPVIMVANHYKTAIRSQWTRSTPDLQDWRGLLDKAVNWLPQAWTGGLSDSVYQWLCDIRSSVRRCCDECDQAFSDACSGQPDMVESTDWRAHWSMAGGARNSPSGW